ncbi:MAG: hypothetical protein H0V82_07185 [Candidatus Protochlamydia sp.]|nr:hypothetical protein [Candidatus Protochlamydia sp.]
MDPYLLALMHGEISPKKSKNKEAKDKFEADLEKELDTYIESLEFEYDPAKSMQNPKLKRENMKLQMEEAMKMPELSDQMEIALNILFEEGSRYLSDEVNQMLISELLASTEKLERIGIQETGEKNLQALTKISDISMKAIEGIAMEKFQQEEFTDCVALFCLMNTLNSGVPEHWLRMGVAAQMNDNIELALKAYAAALALDPNCIEAKLFTVECLIDRKLFDEAKAEVSAAEEIINNNEFDHMWLDMLSDLKKVLETPLKVLETPLSES